MHIPIESHPKQYDDVGQAITIRINDLIRTRCSDTTEGTLRGVFQNFNPLCGRNPMRTDLD